MHKMLCSHNGIGGGISSLGQDTQQSGGQSTTNANQINVSWLYGSYIPKHAPIQPLDANMRFRLLRLADVYNAGNLYQNCLLPFMIRISPDGTHVVYWNPTFHFFHPLCSHFRETLAKQFSRNLGF